MEKVAIVTGSGRGIGEAIALRLAKDGMNLVINDLDRENAKRVAQAVHALGRKALVDTNDVSNHSAAATLVAQAKSQLGRVDVLVNNAGIIRDSLLLKLSEEKWDEVIRVNLKGPFNMGQACAAIMSEQKSGVMINLASIAWLGNVGQTNYAAAKAGVVAMTRTWALELARYGIRCNAIAPGLIDTVMTQGLPAEVKEKFIHKIPLRRIGQVEDIANAVAFLASDQAAYISGQVLHVDGALTTGVSIG